MSRLKVFTIFLLLIGGVWLGWRQVKLTNVYFRPIHYVKIEGSFQYTSKERLQQLLNPLMKRGYYQADMEAVQQAIKTLSMVDKVDVKRVWPDAVYIKITEHKPIVRWGSNALLNKQGEILIPENIEEFKNLPLITGPEGQEKKLLEIMKGIYIVLKDKSMQLAEFHVNDRRAWRIKLASGLEMQLGRKAPLENMQRFLKTMDLIGTEQVEMMANVDTRYPNGYAVTWKPDLPKIDWKAIVEKTRT
ncbi:cell division protein FtsQ/DivIB [Methylomonas sp. AM2-LC]|uniref:cell division protein FtsQ/DivIB n=1 Tax=Methylomonas sp. AM2-LC TaxID=3153301 RepID=UPI003265961A